MEINLTLQLILLHLEVSLIPWLIVSILSVGVGYGLAILLRHWIRVRRRGIDWLGLLPWRSVSVWIALIAINTPITVMLFGLGSLGGGVGVSAALASIMIPWVTAAFLHSWFPSVTRVKILSVVRMAAILSMVLPVFLTVGMGYFIWATSQEAEYQKMIFAYEVLGAMLIGTDIVLGVVQLLLSNQQSRQIDLEKNLILQKTDQ